MDRLGRLIHWRQKKKDGSGGREEEKKKRGEESNVKMNRVKEKEKKEIRVNKERMDRLIKGDKNIEREEAGDI